MIAPLPSSYPKEFVTLQYRERVLQAQSLVQVIEGGYRQLHPIVANYVQHYDERHNKESRRIAHGKAARYYLEQQAKTGLVRGKRQQVRDVQFLLSIFPIREYEPRQRMCKRISINPYTILQRNKGEA